MGPSRSRNASVTSYWLGAAEVLWPHPNYRRRLHRTLSSGHGMTAPSLAQSTQENPQETRTMSGLPCAQMERVGITELSPEILGSPFILTPPHTLTVQNPVPVPP